MKLNSDGHLYIPEENDIKFTNLTDCLHNNNNNSTFVNKQLQINSQGKLCNVDLDTKKNSFKIPCCKSCRSNDVKKALSCTFCDSNICSSCARSCVKCSNLFCHVCSVLSYESWVEEAICLQCCS